MEKDRRNFLKTGLLYGGLSLLPGLPNIYATSSTSRKGEDFPPAEPTPAQKAWMELKFGMFIHFGLNTFIGKEWGDGTHDPKSYNPKELDTDQWCETAKKAGMKYMVLVCKHHDGFCNWFTKQTDYSVKSTTFRRDLLKELRSSADKYGLKLGVYYSLWDRHEKIHDTDEPAYIEFMKRQLKELLTSYGEIVEVWLDGFWKKQQSGWKDEAGNWSEPEDFMKAWRNEGAYRWQIDHLYQYIKSFQPDCIVMNNATTKFPGVPLFPVDALCGEKAFGLTEYKKTWNWLGKEVFLPLQIETTMSIQGDDEFKSGSWFWHEGDHSVLSKERIYEYLETARKLGANLLLNCGPMANGKLRPEDVGMLSGLNLKN